MCKCTPTGHEVHPPPSQSKTSGKKVHPRRQNPGYAYAYQVQYKEYPPRNFCSFLGNGTRCPCSDLYLECSGRGYNGRAVALGDGSPPAGSRGRAPVGVPEAIGTMCL